LSFFLEQVTLQARSPCPAPGGNAPWPSSLAMATGHQAQGELLP
ncbi:unnamed protein product, partial [Urochloa humidicola]